jgi:RNA polymerase sigma factor (sigma-70 family)
LSRPAPRPATLSDIELVDSLLRDAPGAVESFHQRYGQLIHHCIRARAGAQDADDIFQSFFERLMRSEYRALRLWQRGTSLPVYLARVIRNFVTDIHRSRRFREEPVGGTLELDPLAGGHGETISTATHLRELRRIGLQAWSTLESRDRRLVCDRLHRDLDNETIARRLNLAPGTLRTAMSRAQARYLAEVRRQAPEFFPDPA